MSKHPNKGFNKNQTRAEFVIMPTLNIPLLITNNLNTPLNCCLNRKKGTVQNMFALQLLVWNLCRFLLTDLLPLCYIWHLVDHRIEKAGFEIYWQKKWVGGFVLLIVSVKKRVGGERYDCSNLYPTTCTFLWENTWPVIQIPAIRVLCV